MNAMALLEAKKNMAHTIASARSLPGHRNFELPRHSDPGPASVSSSHDFGQVAINPPPIATGACPLSLASPRACPFGGACHTCPTRIQTKLTINEPGDEYEQEADRVAEQVMRMREPPKQEVAPTSKKPLDQTIRRKCAQCDEREALLQTKESPGQAGESAHSLEVPPSVHEVLHSPGQPLNPATRAFMEPRFGYGFGEVRVHTDGRAVESARAVNARAFTMGRDVVFGVGQYAPQTGTGQQLLAHELSHVVQQGASRLNSSPSVRHLRTAPMLQRQRFRDCTPATTGTTGVLTQPEIDEMIRSALRAARLAVDDAATAVRRVINGTAAAAQRAALTSHFGAITAGQRNTVLTRYTGIQTRLANERLFICNTAGSVYCRRGWCAYVDCPGTGHVTHLCPPFFQSERPCGVTRWEVLIEEAAHAMGACGNVAVGGGGYPPANAQNNGPSYASFAATARALAFVRPTLEPPTPERPRFRSLIEDIIRSQEGRMRERILESVPD